MHPAVIAFVPCFFSLRLLCSARRYRYQTSFDALQLQADHELIYPPPRWIPLLTVGDGQVLPVDYLAVDYSRMSTTRPLPDTLWNFALYGVNM